MKKFKIRLYVKENKEVFEIIDVRTDTLIYKYVNKLGQTFIDFIDSDYNTFNNIMAEIELGIKNLRKLNMKRNDQDQKVVSLIDDTMENIGLLADKLVNTHLFYYIYVKYLYDEISTDYSNPDQSPSYDHTFVDPEGYRVEYYMEILKDIVEKFLNDSISKKELISNKFASMLKRNSLTSSLIENLKSPESEHSFFPESLYGYNIFNNESPKLSSIIYPMKIDHIVNYLIIQQIENEVRYRECKNCGKYFVLSGHKGIEYCDRPVDDTGRTCKDIGAMAKYRNKKNDDPVFKAYNKAYKTKNARIRYGMITRDQFKEWSKNARIMRDKCYRGEISLESFTAWLKSDLGFSGILEIK